jgi:hypothetical protein
MFPEPGIGRVDAAIARRLPIRDPPVKRSLIANRDQRFPIPIADPDMHLSLARKYRPRTFADVAVQSHVSATLKGRLRADAWRTATCSAALGASARLRSRACSPWR